jgi:hypothetical protein
MAGMTQEKHERAVGKAIKAETKRCLMAAKDAIAEHEFDTDTRRRNVHKAVASAIRADVPA